MEDRTKRRRRNCRQREGGKKHRREEFEEEGGNPYLDLKVISAQQGCCRSMGSKMKRRANVRSKARQREGRRGSALGRPARGDQRKGAQARTAQSSKGKDVTGGQRERVRAQRRGHAKVH